MTFVTAKKVHGSAVRKVPHVQPQVPAQPQPFGSSPLQRLLWRR